jgi:hypothetical protein
MTKPLWRELHACATAAPPSPDGPGHRYAAMLRVLAMMSSAEVEPGAVSIWLLSEADRADRGE